MGTILSCLTPSRDKKKSSKSAIQPQTLSPTQDSAAQGVREGLADEHLASTPAPAATAAVQGTERIVGLEAPVPLATTTTTSAKMSDADYASFLDKANQDPSSGTAKSESKGNRAVALKTTDKSAKVPSVLTEATRDAFYVSDADEPFVPVCLEIEGGMPDEASFAKLVDHPSPENADIVIMDISEWDPQGQYKEVVDATRAAAKGGDVRVYRINAPKGGSRVEYWLVGVEGKRLVGVKALAIES